MEKYNLKAVVPLDMALGIDRLPFKITVQMMLDISRRAINAHSYEELQQTYKDDWSIVISDDQIRKVVNELGSIIYRYDDLMRKEAERRFASGVRRSVFAGARSGILYIEMDGAMFNTRTTNNGSSWRENKLGAVFNSKDIVYHKTKTGQEVHRILKRQFVSYVGDADTFKAHLYALALENGFESAEKIVNFHRNGTLFLTSPPLIREFP